MSAYLFIFQAHRWLMAAHRLSRARLVSQVFGSTFNRFPQLARCDALNLSPDGALAVGASAVGASAVGPLVQTRCPKCPTVAAVTP